MIHPKRYHPLKILFDLWELIRSLFFFVLILFVFNYGSDSFLVRYGRIIFYSVVALWILRIFYNWFVSKYALIDGAFYLYQGIFNKSERRIPFSKVHNIQRHRSFLHRLLKITSITFETSMSGADAAVKFEAISFIEVDRIETVMDDYRTSEENKDDVLASDEDHSAKKDLIRTLHFKPTLRDTIKAAFTSFSFLLLVPIIMTIYIKIDDVFDLDDKAEGIFESIIDSWWFIAGVAFVLIIASLAFGLIRAFIKYGKYEISSDDERIYITRGVINETAFSISKDKVQAVEINQSLIKRVLGLAEVRLISAGSLGEDDLEASSLYPFLPVGRAYAMIEEILPSYEVSTKMNRLPKRSLWIRILKPYWFWLIATGALFYFKPPVFNIDQAWWMISIALLIIIVMSRLLDFTNSRFTMNDQFIQFKTGSLETSLFITKRDKVVEVNVSQNKFQKSLGLASINMVNRAKPVHHTGIEDVPVDMADSFYTWYAGRMVEIEIERV